MNARERSRKYSQRHPDRRKASHAKFAAKVAELKTTNPEKFEEIRRRRNEAQRRSYAKRKAAWEAKKMES